MEEIRTLRANITPGPWAIYRSPCFATKRAHEELGGNFDPPSHVRIATRDADAQTHQPAHVVGLAESPFYQPGTRIHIEDADAEFIAASPQIVDELLVEVERLRRERDEAVKDRERLDWIEANARDVRQNEDAQTRVEFMQERETAAALSGDGFYVRRWGEVPEVDGELEYSARTHETNRFDTLREAIDAARSSHGGDTK